MWPDLRLSIGELKRNCVQLHLQETKGNNLEQWCIIRFCFCLTETVHNMQEGYGKDRMAEATVFQWDKTIYIGRESTVAGRMIVRLAKCYQLQEIVLKKL